MSDQTKRKIREECKISQAHFQVIMTELKKNKFIIDGKINQKFIPKLNDQSDSFQLLLMFELK